MDGVISKEDLLEWMPDLICLAKMDDRPFSDRDGAIAEDQPPHAAVCKKVGFFFSMEIQAGMREFNFML